MVINTPTETGPRIDGYEIRSAAVAMNIPASPPCGRIRGGTGIESAIRGDIDVRSLQELHAAWGR